MQHTLLERHRQRRSTMPGRGASISSGREVGCWVGGSVPSLSFIAGSELLFQDTLHSLTGAPLHLRLMPVHE